MAIQGSSLRGLEITDMQRIQRRVCAEEEPLVCPLTLTKQFFTCCLEKRVALPLRAELRWTRWGSTARDDLPRQSVPVTLAEGKDCFLLIAGGLVMNGAYCKLPGPASHSPALPPPHPYADLGSLRNDIVSQDFSRVTLFLVKFWGLLAFECIYSHNP